MTTNTRKRSTNPKELGRPNDDKSSESSIYMPFHEYEFAAGPYVRVLIRNGLPPAATAAMLANVFKLADSPGSLQLVAESVHSATPLAQRPQTMIPWDRLVAIVRRMQRENARGDSE